MPATVELRDVSGEDQIAELFTERRPLIARGLGRSYGDPAQLGGGLVLDNRGLTGLSPISPDGYVEVGAGTSLDELLAHAIPRGWFVPVTPGTRRVSIGGAIAADVHGKNHHLEGTFAHHVQSLRLITPAGPFDVSPTNDPDLFWATVGGMGLTGIIVRATIKLLPITTDRVVVDTDRYRNLDEVMAAMSEGDERYRYSVAWVDCMTRGARMGRAILTRGDHAGRDLVERPTLEAPRPARLRVPFDAPSGLLNPLAIKLFNEAWFRSAPQHRVGELQTIGTFFHPLDGVNDWNRLYGRKGFVQYQFAVSDQHGEAVTRAIRLLSDSGVPSFLAVLKRFGPANPAPLSFPQEGWTLALDLPVGPAALPALLDQLDEIVLDAGGRIYLAKDARLASSRVAAMYPRIEEFRRVKRRVDPDLLLTSDLDRRLNLSGR